jgi:hypothetical protein
MKIKVCIKLKLKEVHGRFRVVLSVDFYGKINKLK